MSIRVSRILHAGYELQGGDTKIVFDPIFENPFSFNCYAFPSIEFLPSVIEQQKWNAIFISHIHEDHCSLFSLLKVHKQTPIYIFSEHLEIKDYIEELGFQSVHLLKIDQIVSIGGFKIHVRPALDRDMDSVFRVQYEDLNLLNVVDSWIDPDEFRYLSSIRWDLVLWPFQQMRELEVLSPSRFKFGLSQIYPEHAEQLSNMKMKALIPSSCQFKFEDWSWMNRAFFGLNYETFAVQFKELCPNVPIIRLEPGDSIQMQNGIWRQVEGLSYVKSIEGKNLDYDSEENLTAPTLESYAGRISTLSSSQKYFINQFLDQTLIEKLNAIQYWNSYFVEKTWSLKVIDNHGASTTYFLKLSRDNSWKLVSNPDQFLGWSTQIFESKLHSALVNKESLSSLHLRINDQSFNGEIERQLKDMDFLEDPLLRVLYGEGACAFQKSQLNQIKIKGLS